MKIETHAFGERTAVVITGEIDIDTDQALQHALRKAVAQSVSGVDLDLSGVDFFDCSGLNVLLHIRRRALESGKTVAIRAAGPPVERVLGLTDTSSLFTLTGNAAMDMTPMCQDTRPRATHNPTEEDALPENAEQDLRIEVVQLKRAMQTRPVIDLARGVLMASFALSPEDAWSVLVAVSQNTNTKLHHLAQDLVGAVQGEALPEQLQQQLAAAVTDVVTPPPASTGPADDPGDEPPQEETAQEAEP
ncbi:anti-sigma factor antagonist [Streptomyces sp. NPDC050704]|uniref:anti-sigma factor antagonist n=1 Tax=Streptomyces sp. NPDC050704 TaxID=3157219 RepID=UPI003445057B